MLLEYRGNARIGLLITQKSFSQPNEVNMRRLKSLIGGDVLDIILYSDSLRLIQSCALVNDNFMASPISYDLQGQQGGVVLGAADTVVGDFRWLQVITDTVLSNLASSNLDNANPALIGPTLPAGLGIGGKFTYIEVMTGLVIAYYA
jgi:hypothetical protein